MAALNPGMVLNECWRVLRSLGDGGTSEVYLVGDTREPGRLYALKVLKPEVRHQMADRFRAEGSQRLRHRSIVRVYEGFEYRGLMCLRLAYVESESLAERIRRLGPLPVSEALHVMEDVLSALDYAHLSGFIHRDVKPSNILLDRNGNPHLCDFGIARKLGPNRLTRVGVALGTPHYMSPEQIQTPLECDHRTDLYAAGVVLYEMLTGRVPFGHEGTLSEYAIMDRHISDEPPDPRTFNPAIDDRLTAIIRKSLEKQPGRRFQGGNEFSSALQEYRLGGQPDPTPRTASEPPVVNDNSRYAVYEHPTLRTFTQIERGFSWPALLQGPIWLARYQLFGRASVLFALSMILLFAAQGAYWIAEFVAAAVVWGGIPACWGNQWRVSSLQARGYVLRETQGGQR
jgi:serine/threonine-protein kinase